MLLFHESVYVWGWRQREKRQRDTRETERQRRWRRGARGWIVARFYQRELSDVTRRPHAHAQTHTYARACSDTHTHTTTQCQRCGDTDREHKMILCDSCDGGYHFDTCAYPRLDAIPRGTCLWRSLLSLSLSLSLSCARSLSRANTCTRHVCHTRAHTCQHVSRGALSLTRLRTQERGTATNARSKPSARRKWRCWQLKTALRKSSVLPSPVANGRCVCVCVCVCVCSVANRKLCMCAANGGEGPGVERGGWHTCVQLFVFVFLWSPSRDLPTDAHTCTHMHAHTRTHARTHTQAIQRFHPRLGV